jgi:hypothetical protein
MEGVVLFSFNLFHQPFDLGFNALGNLIVGHYLYLTFLFNVERLEVVRTWASCEICCVANSRVILL